ncbi:NAD-dependent epimerase/dehydratase family protein [Pedobacter glucosidilyticus]|jgi:thioester reductase-like protein|uniref:NAD-dependent epimerase/dehydratase family protein n=1 Tax=Pedobacter glucosidilyticus TaxID=1122941 RepID=UPI0026EA6779|nr:NAD-dependent epimerase/dehydratase family protein [Pedobacter glucosidilyticus]
MILILTGSSGFFGQYVNIEFQNENKITISRTNSNIICDLSSQIPNCLLQILSSSQPEKRIQFQKHHNKRKSFFDVNVLGIQNLLKGLEQAPSLPISFVFISSVAVYGLD